MIRIDSTVVRQIGQVFWIRLEHCLHTHMCMQGTTTISVDLSQHMIQLSTVWLGSFCSLLAKRKTLFTKMQFFPSIFNRSIVWWSTSLSFRESALYHSDHLVSIILITSASVYSYQLRVASWSNRKAFFY